MRCIFCKLNSDASKSIEHIIPESLGNKSHTLPKGMVCDKCNNYFAVKIESRVLANPYFKSLRHRNEILTKKGRLPSETAFVGHPSKGNIEIVAQKDNIIEINVPDPSIFELVINGNIKELYVPIIPMPEENDLNLSRLLAKMALEVMAQRISKIENWNDEFVDDKDIDRIRNYARYGSGGLWPYTRRRVYNEYEIFEDNNDGTKPVRCQLLHEYDYHSIDNIHLIFVCIILGVEYSINVADRNVDLYLTWLKNNNGLSPLTR